MPDALLLTDPRRSDSKEIPDSGRTNELLRQINSSTAPCASASPEIVAEFAKVHPNLNVGIVAEEEGEKAGAVYGDHGNADLGRFTVDRLMSIIDRLGRTR